MISNEKYVESLDSVLVYKKADPRILLLLISAILVSMFYSDTLWIHIILFLITFILLLSLKIKFFFIVKSITFFSIAAGLGTFFAYLEHITTHPFILFIVVLSRFANSFFIISCFFNYLSEDDIYLVLEAMSLPLPIIWSISSTYNFIPNIIYEASLINDIRKIKGLVAKRFQLIKGLKIMIKLLRPLLVRSINRSIDVAESMILKGYNTETRPTQILVIKPKFISLITLFVVWALVAAQIYFHI